MTTFRLISLPMHGFLELFVGLALLAAPFGLGLAPAGMVLAVGFGVLIVGLSLGSADSLPVSAHLSFDQSIVIGLAGAAIAVVAADADRVSGLVLASAALAQLALTLSTRYSRVPGAR